ncbi:MAG: SET domain-containing protein [Candidatus Pacearchaeota archaeon]|nr:SET domain-containing protein [Candidatus Pacearchaeota archaeon]
MKKDEIKETSLILKPSKGKGIGVFAIEDIQKGKRLYWGKVRYLSKKVLIKNKILFFLCDEYGIEMKDKYECPPNFQKMGLVWYLNHSKKPNMSMGKTFYFTTRKIKKGEELIVDYKKFNEPNQQYLKEYKK